MHTIAFATYRKAPELSEEDQAVAAQLALRHISVQAAVWNDPAVQWDHFAAVIIRTSWDYHQRPAEFRQWLDRLARGGVPLWNPGALVRWNMDKTYLRELAQRGVLVVPTVWLAQGSAVQLSAVLAEQGWQQAVVKPAISASAFGTFRTSMAQADADQPQFAALLARSGMLVQAFQHQIRTNGEWSLMFLGGDFSHAVLKQAGANDFRVQRAFGGSVRNAVPSSALVAQAAAVVAKIHTPWLYARVDGIEVDGELRLMELELIEPWLFLQHDAQAAVRFALAIAAAVR